jgi:GntR family transcriptional regulator
MPTPEEQQLLQLDTGQPVLTVTRVAHADIPVEVNDMILAGDRYELSYEWPAD